MLAENERAAAAERAAFAEQRGALEARVEELAKACTFTGKPPLGDSDVTIVMATPYY